MSIIYGVLRDLRKDIEDHQRELDKSVGGAAEAEIEIIKDLFKEGIDILARAKPGEVTPSLIDWFIRKDSLPPLNKEENSNDFASNAWGKG